MKKPTTKSLLSLMLKVNNITHFKLWEIIRGRIIPTDLVPNIEDTLIFAEIMRKELGFQMTFTNTFRTWEDHVRIYKEKGIPLSGVPKKSLHLSFNAIDIIPLNTTEEKVKLIHDYCNKNKTKGMGIGYYPWGIHLDFRIHLGRRSYTWGNKLS